jgi:hypothetical protein
MLRCGQSVNEAGDGDTDLQDRTSNSLANDDLGNYLNCTDIPIIFLDEELRSGDTRY